MATARSRVLHPGPSYCGAQRARAGVRRRRRQPGTPAPPGAPRSGCSRSIRWAAVSKETTEDSAHRPQVSRALVGSAEGQCPLWVVSFLTYLSLASFRTCGNIYKYVSVYYFLRC